MSGVFQNIDPPPPSPPGECVCTPPLVRGEDTLAGWRGGGGSIFWKTPDTALYSTYVRWNLFLLYSVTRLQSWATATTCPSGQPWAPSSWARITSPPSPQTSSGKNLPKISRDFTAVFSLVAVKFSAIRSGTVSSEFQAVFLLLIKCQTIFINEVFWLFSSFKRLIWLNLDNNYIRQGS